VTAVAVFVAETVALATTPPDGSVTVPERVAPVTWACATTPAIKLKISVTKIAKPVANFLKLPTPMQRLLDEPSWAITRNVKLDIQTDFLIKTPQSFETFKYPYVQKSSAFSVICSNICENGICAGMVSIRKHQTAARRDVSCHYCNRPGVIP
jgi:hypothetical protein